MLVAIGIMAFVLKIFVIGDAPPDPSKGKVQNFLTSAVQLSPTPHPDTVALMETQKVVEGIVSDKNRLLTENERLSSVVSRGQARKPKVILDYDKLSAPRYIVELTERMAYQHGFDTIAVPYCIMYYESRFNPTCHNTKGEDSRGLFQVNVADPSHAKRNPNRNKLFDPAYNMDYQLDELAIYYKQGRTKGLSGTDLICYVAKHGQRPRWSKTIEVEIAKAYKEYSNAVIK